MIASHLVLKWLHIVAMVYWLGGEWGVFQTSYHVTNPKLSLDERRRHMETAYRIDILARLGIILLLPIGLHMGHNFGVQPLGGNWLVLMWILTAGWIALALTAFAKRGTDAGIRLTRMDDRIRYVLIPALMICAISSRWAGRLRPARSSRSPVSATGSGALTRASPRPHPDPPDAGTTRTDLVET